MPNNKGEYRAVDTDNRGLCSVMDNLDGTVSITMISNDGSMFTHRVRTEASVKRALGIIQTKEV